MQVAPAPSEPAPSVSAADARAAYQLAKKQFRQGDWIAARQNFNVARDANYKPGLFEGDSPERYLARMDAKESRDRARAEADARRQGLTQPAPSEPAPAEAVAQPVAPPVAPPVARAGRAESEAARTGD